MSGFLLFERNIQTNAKKYKKKDQTKVKLTAKNKNNNNSVYIIIIIITLNRNNRKRNKTKELCSMGTFSRQQQAADANKIIAIVIKQR